MKIIAKSSTAMDMATALAVALSLGVWDAMTYDERQAWTERGEVWDTPPGRIIFGLIQRANANPNLNRVQQ